MAASKYGKQIAAFLESRGFAPVETTRTAVRWAREGSPDVKIPGGINEGRVRMIIRDVNKIDGVASVSAVRKRNTPAIKARQQSERERLAEERSRRQQELAEYEQAAEKRMGGMSTTDWNAVCAEIERREREIREIERLMAAPTSGHGGAEHAKHRA